jgi:N-acetylglucosamine-6-phosphate deacetylase
MSLPVPCEGGKLLAMRLKNARLVMPDRIVAGSLDITEGRIARLHEEPARAVRVGKERMVVDLKGGFLAPGFIDLHVHGALGRDTMEASEAAFRVITQYHLAGGTTSMTLTTVSASQPAILAVLEAARPWQGRSLGGARLLGIHLEGPYLSSQKAGAHDPAQLRRPKAREWRRYLRYGGLITQMTVAPELPGALVLFRALKRNGSIISAGHSNATEAQLSQALEIGIQQATHTYNCMSTATKHGPYRVPGLLEVALAEPGICCELIADGCHVAPTLIRLLYRAKGGDGICLITDAIPGAGLPVGTVFRVGGPTAELAKVTPEAALLKDGSALSGSILTMIEAVRRAVGLGKIPLAEAVRMATLNPARQLNRAAEFGSLACGKRADLVWFDEQYRVRAVWMDGDLRFWR